MTHASSIKPAPQVIAQERSALRWWSVPLMLIGVIVLALSWAVPAIESWEGVVLLRFAALFAVMGVGMNLVMTPVHQRRAAAERTGPMTIAGAFAVFFGAIAWFAVFGLVICAVVYGSMPTLREILSFAPMGLLCPLVLAVSGYIFSRRAGRDRFCPTCGTRDQEALGTAGPMSGGCSRCKLPWMERFITARPGDLFGGPMRAPGLMMIAMFVCFGLRGSVMPLIDGWFPGLVP